MNTRLKHHPRCPREAVTFSPSHQHNNEKAMKKLISLATVCLALAGCSSSSDDSSAGSTFAPRMQSADSPTRYMAYEHWLQLDVAEDRVAAVHHAAEAACLEAIQEQCVILNSQVATGREVSAQIKVRATAKGVRDIIAVVSTEGHVIQQSVSAEDLATPIQDSTRKLAMLEDYREKLEALRVSAKDDVDSLIKVNKELAEVQAELEAITGEQKHLMKRVNTETLSIHIAPVNASSFWRPIAQAIEDFGGNLATGVSSAITALAFIIPWSLVLLPFLWAGRSIWRRSKRSAAKARHSVPDPSPDGSEHQ